MDIIHGNREGIFNVFHGENGCAGGDVADDGHLYQFSCGKIRIVGRFVQNFDSAWFGRIPADIAFFLQACQMTVNGGGGLEPNKSHGRKADSLFPVLLLSYILKSAVVLRINRSCIHFLVYCPMGRKIDVTIL